MTEIYRNSGLEIYEKSHYSHGEHIAEVEKILSWYSPRNTRILDIGCSGGLHVIEFANRGFSVTGLDIEPSAIELAKKRIIKNKQKAEFRVIDIETDEFSDLGKFDFIYSIGNVLSHVRKETILDVLRKIRERLNEKGIFLFDVLINAKPFQEEIHPEKNDLQILWKRKIDEKTGRISMDGTFLEFDFAQHFDVWGYTIEEITEWLNMLSFKEIEFSERLDFANGLRRNKIKNSISLYFRVES